MNAIVLRVGVGAAHNERSCLNHYFYTVAYYSLFQTPQNEEMHIISSRMINEFFSKPWVEGQLVNIMNQSIKTLRK